MKILRVLPSMDFAGIERGVYDFSLEADRMGHHVIVVSGYGRFIPLLKQKGIDWHDLSMDNKNIKIFAHAKKELRKIIDKEKPDIIHSESRFPCWIMSSVIKQFPGIGWVTSIHSFCHLRFWTKSLGFGQRIIVVSNAIKEYAIKYLKVPEEKLRLVYNGVSKNDFFDIKKEINETPVIGMIARFSKTKGHFYYMKAMKKLLEEGEKVKGILVGTGSEKYKKRIHACIVRNKMENSIEILSMDSRQALKKMDVLSVPSFEPEGFGRVVVEAQMAGVPVVASNIGAIPELIENKRTGFLVEPRDSLQMVEAIKYILLHPRETGKITENAQKISLEKFTVEKMTEETLKVYQELI
ncbi:MAG: glycosyltransferase family 4 protein [Candidatus Omnitrophica bacterium]|nr:glycosyltransferase family 4 protein [Candidatus Omnitrophota bacterium]